jgi:diadenosine tetraphosphate (Ap4A) HIT family hydrolase
MIELTKHSVCEFRASDKSTHCESCVCSLCEEFAGTSAPLLKEVMSHEVETRILWEGNDWLLIPTIGPLTPGHLLLVPRKHYFSVLRSPSEVLTEFNALLERCASKLQSLYKKDVLVFEHGTIDGQKNCGACIEHAHLHIAPGPSTFISSATSEFPGWSYRSTITDLIPLIGNSPYMLIGSVKPQPFFGVRQCRDHIPSQFLRRVFAQELEEKVDWDWRKHPNANTFLKTMNDWKSNV